MWQLKVIFLVALVALLALPSATVPAASDNRLRAKLSGYEETPLSISSPASGRFRARIREDAKVIEFELAYEGLPTTVLFAHVHFGRPWVTGGVSAFLCGGGPRPLPPCPSPGGTVRGTIIPSDVIGPAGQGIAAGEFDELVAAMRAGATYANLHTMQFPGGEIRGQIGDLKRKEKD